MKNIYEKIIEVQRSGPEAVVCTIVNTKGSTPRKVGTKMIVYADGKIFGTIGGGELEKSVIKDAVAQINKNEPEIFRHELLHQHGMCCGGTVDIYIEPIMKKSKLYIFGAGHTGQALAKYAVNFPFDVVLIDDRIEFLDECNIEEVSKLNLTHEQALPVLPFDESTYIWRATVGRQR